MPPNGTLIGGRYQLLEQVGDGGMSTVWRGLARSGDLFVRPVALKVTKGGYGTQSYLRMFLEEARIGAELQHAHLVQVLDFVAEHGPPAFYCMVMEWIEGIDLRSLIRVMVSLGRPLPWGLVAHLGIGVLRGLAAAHERRLADGRPAPILHRDVSPQNILLGLNGSIKLADFGFAHARDRGERLTAPGVVKGTVSYMAPEVLRAQQPTVQSDLYSVACTLWEVLVGERLFDAPTDVEVVLKIRAGEVRPLENERPDVPLRMCTALHRALAPDPAARFPAARAMAQELGEILRESSTWIDSDVAIGTTVAQARDAVGVK